MLVKGPLEVWAYRENTPIIRRGNISHFFGTWTNRVCRKLPCIESVWCHSVIKCRNDPSDVTRDQINQHTLQNQTDWDTFNVFCDSVEICAPMLSFRKFEELCKLGESGCMFNVSFFIAHLWWQICFTSPEFKFNMSTMVQWSVSIFCKCGVFFAASVNEDIKISQIFINV